MRFQFLNEKGGARGFLLNLLAAFAILTLAFFLAHRYFAKPPSVSNSQSTPIPSSAAFQGDPTEATEKLLKTLNQKLQDMDLLKLLEKDVETKPATVNGKVFPTYMETFRLPLRYSAEQIKNELAKTVEPLGAQVTDKHLSMSMGPPSFDKYVYSFAYNGDWTPVEINFQVVSNPRICFIIDDGGYQKGKALEALYGFKVPVTVSIIPDVEFSKSLATEFPDHGVEVMCHMPMEGHEKGMVGANYKELLKKGMEADEAKLEVEKALENLPNCRGLNNHMGSVATEDPELMADVCEVLKARGLFIIDSRTTAKSTMEVEAEKIGVPVAGRNVFLDNVETPEAILKQLSQAVSYAKRHGLAVAIGHFKPITLQTLESAIPKLKEEGFQFVYASEVVREE
ncbi:MAG TPA: divergent polysaccharide deacetylase family protein [bacterium]|nr:divergent polysaccharide deacetylase family protein [bacterium]